MNIGLKYLAEDAKWIAGVLKPLIKPPSECIGFNCVECGSQRGKWHLKTCSFYFDDHGLGPDEFKNEVLCWMIGDEKQHRQTFHVFKHGPLVPEA